ncbi:sigma-70 family RNA polymerase sigma factor [Candidatus Poribacteria bacterium]|jgi:RNA polymerase sigma factor (sigma-70 family)|nr:sigma-70 family RNA polymerase sigma factor [Candidatus Poribacteria bacterium]MBT5532409.1 sigma-70 family RNA polymerase sigma factor [Candidatus Poribacteria bacterium]MBT5710587.1 sigma-70 family RNA polymerase sigma factor [Candidatus Poribacteria bacterium]MBT7096416.1 sigma-70 family RNA polymerase sigma factor [Candidatus Poribacteria bacterium]MBT7807672.1 sigma-70 family RNA polymerase sigma factor [Candidatus Poribacteria bacterium]
MAYGYAYALLGDGRLAEDTAQEAFIVAWRRLEDVRNAEAFPGWSRRVVRTQCDRLTRGKRLPTVTLEAAAQVRSTDARPDVHVEAQETRARVATAVRSLPEAERVATTLYYLDGHTQNEIARFLGIKSAAVSTRLYSARQRLKGRPMHMVREDVRGTRPSRDEAFVRDVLFRSIQEGDAEKVSELVGSDASLLNASDEQGRTPIEALSKSEHPNTVRRDFDKRRGIYEFLTERGAAPDLPVAIAMNDISLAEGLIRRRPEQIDAPLTAPSPAYGMRRLRMRPLAIAIAFHREEIARVLLAAGADVHADNDQAAVIAATVPAHLLSILRLLMDHGAQPNPHPNAPYGPLASACEWLEGESARALIEAGADPNAPVYATYTGTWSSASRASCHMTARRTRRIPNGVAAAGSRTHVAAVRGTRESGGPLRGLGRVAACRRGSAGPRRRRATGRIDSGTWRTCDDDAARVPAKYDGERRGGGTAPS